MSTTDDDAVLTLAIRRRAGGELHRHGDHQPVWGRAADAFPDAEIRLLKPPVTSVNSVTYVDAAGATQTCRALSYSLDAATFPGWLLPACGTSGRRATDQRRDDPLHHRLRRREFCARRHARWLLLTAAFIYAQRG